jgi:hypothetical protein
MSRRQLLYVFLANRIRLDQSKYPQIIFWASDTKRNHSEMNGPDYPNRRAGNFPCFCFKDRLFGQRTEYRDKLNRPIADKNCLAFRLVAALLTKIVNRPKNV